MINTKRGETAAILLLAGLVVGAVPSLALATPKSHTGLRVKATGWLVSVAGTTTKVPPNSTLAYCASQVQYVESVTPRLVLSAPKADLYYYGYHMVDPKGHRSVNIFGTFTGTRTVLERPFQPLNWGRAEARVTNPLFQTGIYSVELALNGRIVGGHTLGGKMESVEKIRMKEKKSC